MTALTALTVDGVTLSVNDRVLVKGKSAVQNGIYKVTATGGASSRVRISKNTDAENTKLG